MYDLHVEATRIKQRNKSDSEIQFYEYTFTFRKINWMKAIVYPYISYFPLIIKLSFKSDQKSMILSKIKYKVEL